MNESNDDPRDARLLAALRHAPHRDATPPREVSERILAAARAAARSSRAAVRLPHHQARAPWWQRVSAWLTQPQVAASFGTLVVASLVGVMWSTREPPVAEFTPPPAAAERVEPRRTPAPAVAPQADAAKTEAGVAAASSAAPPVTVNEARPQAAPVTRPKQAPAMDATVRRDSGPESDRESGPEARQRAAAAPPAETTAVSSVAPPPAAVAAPAPQAADAAMPAAAAERRSAGASESRVLDLRREAAPKPASAAALGMALAAKASAAAEPLASLDALLGAVDRASRLSWVRGSSSVPYGEAQRAWWRGVRESTQGHWERVEPAVQPLAPWLVLRAEGGTGFILWPVNDHLFIADANGRTWSAPITPAQREAWTAEVARW